MPRRNYMHLFLNPRPQYSPLPNPREVYNRILLFIKKKFWLIFFFFFLFSLLLGFLIESGSNLSIYEDFDITSGSEQPTGWFWDLLWWWRGQPAGWQTDVGGHFAIVNLGGDGFNGPLTVWGLLTEAFVDLALYLPTYINPLKLISKLDTVHLFLFKFIVDLACLAILIIIVVPLLLIFFFFLPLILQRLFMSLGVISRMLAMLFIVTFLYFLLTGRLDNFIDSFLAVYTISGGGHL